MEYGIEHTKLCTTNSVSRTHLITSNILQRRDKKRKPRLIDLKDAKIISALILTIFT